MKFIVQNMKVPWDFIMELYRAEEYWKWRDNPFKIYYDIPKNENIQDLCPVGSVEFVCSWYKDIFNKYPQPRNIPLEMTYLEDYKHRNIKYYELSKDKITESQFFYLKSATKIKADFNGLYNSTDDRLNSIHDTVYISPLVENIISEWRCFVYNSEILDIKCYSGDPWTIPKKLDIHRHLDNFTKTCHDKLPPSYTIDVGVTESKETELIEIHDFFSCGLYGFSDYNKYPYMLWRWFKWFTK